MRKLYLLLAFYLFTGTLKAQCPNYQNSQITSQSQIDNFKTNYPNCNGQMLGEWPAGLTISGTSITNLNGLSQVTALGYLSIKNCPNLPNLQGLQNLHTVNELTINNADLLTNLSGLDELNSVNKKFEILNNDNLLSLNGLKKIHTISNLEITNNLVLNSLSALINVTNTIGNDVDNYFQIENNPSLVNLDGIDNISFNTDIAGSMFFILSGNSSLSFCSKSNICSYINAMQNKNPEIVVQNNSTNCNSISSIVSSCSLSVNVLKKSKVNIYPNPTSDFIFIKDNLDNNVKYSIVNVMGGVVYKGETDYMVDFSSYPRGIYFLELQDNYETETFKILKM